MILDEGLWAIRPASLEAIVARVERLEKATGPLGSQDVETTQEVLGRFSRGNAVRREGSKAIVDVKGVILKRGNAWLRFFGIPNTGLDEIRSGLREAIEDREVEEIVLHVASPGGTADGVAALADELYQAREEKPLRAFVDGMGGSAAYYLASQAESISALKDSLVGSIGVYAVMTDTSEAAGKAGVKVHVVRSGPHKGAGIRGAPITDGQLAVEQGVVDSIAEGFVAAVARGRGMRMKQVEALATGAHWTAQDALELGLVDEVGTFESIISPDGGRSLKMADQDARASLSELKSRFPDRPGFVLEQLENSASMEAAESAFVRLQLQEKEQQLGEKDKQLAKLEAELEELRQKNKELTAELEAERKKNVPPSGVEPVGYNGGSGSPASSGGDFLELAEAYKDAHGCTLTQAMKAIVKKDPQAHREWVEKRKARR